MARASVCPATEAPARPGGRTRARNAGTRLRPAGARCALPCWHAAARAGNAHRAGPWPRAACSGGTGRLGGSSGPVSGAPCTAPGAGALLQKRGGAAAPVGVSDNSLDPGARGAPPRRPPLERNRRSRHPLGRPGARAFALARPGRSGAFPPRGDGRATRGRPALPRPGTEPLFQREPDPPPAGAGPSPLERNLCSRRRPSPPPEPPRPTSEARSAHAALRAVRLASQPWAVPGTRSRPVLPGRAPGRPAPGTHAPSERPRPPATTEAPLRVPRKTALPAQPRHRTRVTRPGAAGRRTGGRWAGRAGSAGGCCRPGSARTSGARRAWPGG